MPLPDERPRQSVANLIGRFEQQGKRQPSPAVPVVPRSSSVSSQIAGDAAKEEVKEKREWPPKPVQSTDIKQLAPTFSSSPSSSMSKSPIISPQPIPESAPSPVDIPTTPIPASPEPVNPPPPKGKAVVAAGKSTTHRPVASPPRARPPPANNPSAKSLVGSPPKQSLQSSVSQPLKSQHTGQSVVSNPSTTRQPRPMPRTAPSTPSRPKSSAAQNQAITRPKTPSSGLFAPTAASLARSRKAPPPPPPPVKKVTLSSDAAERLSKPTAASLSKARTPVPPALSPARVTKSISTGTHNSIPGGPSKPKAVRTPLKPNATKMKEEAKSGLASVSSEPSPDSDHRVADHAENGRESGTHVISHNALPEDTHGLSGVISGTMHDPAANEEVHHDSKQQADGHLVEDEVHGDEHAAQVPPAEEAVHEHEPEQVHLEVDEEAVPKTADPQADQTRTNGESLKVELVAPGNDIEDIVNLLEGASLPKQRPQSIVSIPDEHGEIPDEY